jgi:hypothetical protein
MTHEEVLLLLSLLDIVVVLLLPVAKELADILTWSDER